MRMEEISVLTLPDANYFQQFFMENQFVHDTLDGFPFSSMDFRDAYHQALLDVLIKEDDEKAYKVSHLPISRSTLCGLPPVHQQGVGDRVTTTGCPILVPPPI
jgi:hypothetical protein